jgi:hypothetical protein
MYNLLIRYKKPYGKGTMEKGVIIDNEDRLNDVIVAQKASAKDSGIKIVKMWKEDSNGN